MSQCSRDGRSGFTVRAVLLGLTISLLGAGAAACTAKDNGGVIQGPGPTAATTSTTAATSTSSPGGTLPGG